MLPFSLSSGPSALKGVNQKPQSGDPCEFCRETEKLWDVGKGGTWQGPKVALDCRRLVNKLVLSRQSKVGHVSFNKNSLKRKEKQNQKQNIHVSYRQSPPLRHHNSTLTLCSTFYFVFKLHFKKKGHFFFSTISHNSLIKHSIYHKPLSTRSQVSSYWLWFIDE